MTGFVSGRRRLLTIVVWLALVATALVVVARARFTADLSAFLPQHPTPEQAVLIDQVREGPASQLLLVAIEAASRADGAASRDDALRLAGLSKRVAATLRDDARFQSVTNGESVNAEADRRLLFERRYLLSERTTPERYTAAGLHAALVDSVELLGSSAGLMLQPLIARDPTAELLGLIDTIAAGRDLPTVAGAWVARPKDGAPHALMIVETRAPGSDVDAQQAAIGAVRAAFAKALADEGASAASARLIVTGPPVFAVDSRNTIERDATRVSLIGASLVLSLLWSVYRSARALVLGLVPMLTGALCGLAVVAAVYGTVHAITLGFGVTLIGEAVDYAIYLFVQRPFAAPSSHDASGRARGFWRTIALGVVTSAIGFASLVFSGFQGLAQVGVLSISGLAAAALVTRFVLPAMMPAGFTVRRMDRVGALLARATAVAPHARWLLVAFGVVAIAVLIHHRDRLWSDDLASLSPVSEEALATDGRLRSELGAPDVRDLVVVSGADQQAVLRGSERVVAALSPLVADGTLLGVDAPSRYLPSDMVQRARQAALPDDATLRSRFVQALEGLPFRKDGSAERFAGFFEDVAREKAGPLVTRADFDGTSLAVGLRALLSQRQVHEVDGSAPTTRWVALIALRSPQDANEDAKPVAERPRAKVAATIAMLTKDATFDGSKDRGYDHVDIRAIDLGAGVKALYAGYLAGAVHVGALGGLAIVALLAVVLRSPMRLARVLLPLALSVLLVAAAQVAWSGPLNLFHLVGLLLIVAVGSNYALFFDRRAAPDDPATGPTADTRREAAPDADHALLASLLVANLTTVIGFGALSLSAFPILHAIGTTVAPGALLALVLAASWAAVHHPSR